LAVGHIRGGLSRSLRHGFRGQGFDQLLSGFLSWRKAIFAPRPAAARSGLLQPATRRGNRQMGIVALARQESRAKAVDMTLWVGQSLAQRQPVGPCPKLAIPPGFAGPNFWPAPPTAGQRGRHAKICKTQSGWGTSRNRLGLRGAPTATRARASHLYIAVSPTPIIRATTSGLSPSCTRHTRFQGRMIQLAGVIFSHAPITRDRPRRENCALIYERINSLAFAANHAKIT
jgi:hypothetical protein